ncbi:MAG: hypothetical protein HC859_02495 [Bacteroidia bacterium]|nr:hypothetical protein [Bacteroidia bacterium]
MKGDKKKAVEMYAELSTNSQNIPLIHNNYVNTLLDLGMYKEAEDYLKKISRRDPNNLQYKLDQGILHTRAGEVNKADKYFKDLIQENKSSVQRIKMLSDYLSSKSLGKYSILALNESREFLGNSFLFCLDLAMLYRIQGEKDKMVREYLSYVTQNAGNLQYVKNVMQALLTKPDELESLERLLYDKVQQYPDTEVYADLLIWVTMQQKNFYASFIQARAFDKRYKNEGEKTMEVARVALDNNDYENAYKIYSYVIREFENTPNQMLARLGLIRTREARIRNSFPVSKDSVRVLVKDYQNFIAQYPSNSNALEATRNMALLYANYLDQKDDAVNTLENLVSNPRTSTYLKSKAKLDLGDIYLLKGEPGNRHCFTHKLKRRNEKIPSAMKQN